MAQIRHPRHEKEAFRFHVQGFSLFEVILLSVEVYISSFLLGWEGNEGFNCEFVQAVKADFPLIRTRGPRGRQRSQARGGIAMYTLA